MTMKLIMLVLGVSLSIGCRANGADPGSQGHEWKAKVRVVGQDGGPVKGATVTIGFYVPAPANESIGMDKVTGVTDSSGIFTASHKDNSVDLFFSGWKEGYYKSAQTYELGMQYQYDPVKWSPDITFMLKKVIDPIPMYAKKIRQGPPVADKPVGYDLEVGDWMPPYGKGIHMDVIFTARLTKFGEDDWDYKLVVSFPNPGDGIQPFTLSENEKTSALRSPHRAPLSGYLEQWIKTQSQHPGEAAPSRFDEKLNFFLRVRTTLDEKGVVKTANYGKIYGDFMNFRYYYNPVVNSANLEFDPGKNLLKNLSHIEKVGEP